MLMRENLRSKFSRILYFYVFDKKLKKAKNNV